MSSKIYPKFAVLCPDELREPTLSSAELVARVAELEALLTERR